MTSKDRSKAYSAALPLTKRLTYRLSRLQSRLNARATRILREKGGLTLMQWRVLVLADTLGTSTLGEMVKITQFDKGLLSRTIKSLHTKKLIALGSDPMDQRVQTLSITEAGRTLYDAAEPAMRERQSALLADFTSEEIEAIYAAFDRFEAVLDREEES